MDRDLRESPLYREVEEHFRKVYEPGFGKVTEPSDPRPSPDGRWVAFTGSLWEKLEGTPKTRICLAPLGREGSAEGAEPAAPGRSHRAPSTMPGPGGHRTGDGSASSPTVERRDGCSSTS